MYILQQTTRCRPAFRRDSWMWYVVNLWYTLARSTQMVSHMDMLIRVCPRLHGSRAGQTSRSIAQDRQQEEGSSGIACLCTSDVEESMWRARSWEPRMLWGGSLHLAFMPLLLPWRRSNQRARLSLFRPVRRPLDSSVHIHQNLARSAIPPQLICSFHGNKSKSSFESWSTLAVIKRQLERKNCLIQTNKINDKCYSSKSIYLFSKKSCQYVMF